MARDWRVAGAGVVRGEQTWVAVALTSRCRLINCVSKVAAHVDIARQLELPEEMAASCALIDGSAAKTLPEVAASDVRTAALISAPAA